ncbi:MAG: hypothetical protein COU71_00685, partial [Parcubacteria group bacterium CG10_big_fil_rev_8_21_14_0_10_38_31]
MKKVIIVLMIVLILTAVLIGIFSGGLGGGAAKWREKIDGLTVNVADGDISDLDLKCPECNLIIISLTNTRKDHIGIYGYERDTTPNIDKFFKNSLVFENAFAPTSWTLPNNVSFSSSLFPYTHGVMDRIDRSKLSDDVLTFAEVLKENGYKTTAFTGGGDYNRFFNIAQGFDLYVDEDNYTENNVDILSTGGPSRYSSAESLVPASVKWLENNANSKFFFFLQGFDTHCPFTPKEPFDKKFDQNYKGDIDFSTCLWTFKQTDPLYKDGVKYWTVKTSFTLDGTHDIDITERDLEHMLALYDGEISQADDSLGKFFQTMEDLGLEKNTIFIFMSEHGDLFGEHGRFMRGGPLRGTFYDPVLNFPLLIKHPKLDKPVKIDILVQTVDLMPTLLDILGLDDPEEEKRQGQSLFGKETSSNEYVYAGSQFKAVNSEFFNGLSVVEVIRSKEWKLIKEEIFSVENGP